MLIDGEKYACEACVRGHRVSSCQHADRPLQHINKKGRPVSQCPHCRALRKNRATHAACECGSKPHKREDHDDRSETKSDPGCCCTHGMRCTCALKKEPLDPVPEMDPPSLPGPMKRTTSNKKPRLAKAGSDNSLTAFATTNQRPAHRRNNSAQRYGMPYKVPIPHSMPGRSKATARRSTDSLPLLKRKGSPRDAPLTGASGMPPKRTSKSEQGSPVPRNVDQPGPLDFNFTLDSMPQFDVPSTFYTPHQETPGMSGFDMSPPTEWPSFDTPFHYSSYTERKNPYSTFDQQHLAASSSSGEVSDVSDYISPAGSRPQLSAADSDDSNIRRFSPAAYPSMPHNVPSLPSEENLSNRLSPTSIHNVAQNRPSNFSSEESLASRSSILSPVSYPALSQQVSPVDQPFQPPRSETFEESFLPPTSSPKQPHTDQTNQAPFAHNLPPVNTHSTSQVPTSSPKQPQGSFQRPRQPTYNVPHSIPERSPLHPMELTPIEFSQATSVHEHPERRSIHLPEQQPFKPAAQQSPHPPQRQQLRPTELTPAQFSQASPGNPSAGLFAKPSVYTQEAQRMPHPSITQVESSTESVDELKSPAVGGLPEDFTKNGLSPQDAHRLAHPSSQEKISSPGGFEKRGLSVQDAQRLAHPETPSEGSSGSPITAGEGPGGWRSDAFRHPGLSVQDAQRLAHPLTPTEALSGLTIPQTSQSNSVGRGDQEETNVWAAGRAGSSDPDSATSYVSQQEVEGTQHWGS